jgi:hypothetical protein
MWGEVDRDEVLQVWGETLGGFEPPDIREALGAMTTAHVDYPPTLPQFAGLCMDAKRRRLQALPRLNDDGTRVPMPAHIREQLDTFLGKAAKW